ncbi:MAG: aerotolerance regulator BatA [Bacteroidetes bacterium]|nr:MAG: aerotolerance regulator BatA [Bacteroidota bacterium]RLD76830.1 MAG: aerotolerance regulator BatA [Bacteroidota bacterium]
MEFTNPEFLYGLIVLIPMIVWYVLKDENNYTSIQISSLRAFPDAPKTYKYFLRHFLFGLKLLLIAVLIVILARPQSTNRWEDKTTEGIDIIIALDISSSMLARDFRPNRLEASKDVAINFISGRENDRLGLVVFSGESFTQCPLTTDHAVLINLFKDIKQGMIEDGTAIGMGLANGVNRLKDSDAISKVIILLTDGVNNMGAIDPITSAQLAQKFGIRVYTVGVGKNGFAPYPVQTMFGIQYQDMEVKIDEKTLKKIAKITDGKYFRATNNNKLKQIYKEINKLEKSKIEIKKFSSKNDEFMPLAYLAIILLLSILLLRYTILRNIP